MIRHEETDVAVQVGVESRTLEIGADWRLSLPTLCGERVALRELHTSDAPALFETVTPPEVSRFLSPPPPNVATFERFIACSRDQQAAGKLACFAVTLRGHDRPIGIFQVRELEANFKTAEWGFAIASPFWGTGLFEECAELVLEFAFTRIGVQRMEARAAVKNGRGNRALQKVGAVQEGVLHAAFLCGGEYVDQVIYAMAEEDWRASRGITRVTKRVIVH
jgi:[ribosomal protein S5]-alanine N-acetyltransferase